MVGRHIQRNQSQRAADRSLLTCTNGLPDEERRIVNERTCNNMYGATGMNMLCSCRNAGRNIADSAYRSQILNCVITVASPIVHLMVTIVHDYRCSLEYHDAANQRAKRVKLSMKG